MTELSNPLVLILSLVALLGFILYLWENNLRRRQSQQGQKMLETLHNSIQKSQDIVGQAELEGVKMLSDTRFQTAKLEQQYAAKLTEVVEQSKQAIAASQAQLVQFLQTLQSQSQQTQLNSQKAAEERINQMFGTLEQRLSDFLLQTSQKTTSSIELEVKSARALIESYKQQQMKLIDENIVAMMEETLNVVLGKKLSLKDQLDLVYEALEKAKVDKFII
ncbi:hypothetical protein HYS94_03475 [Candidatus Daviesbacteria bacterium]|nr:hypothetical protein [Candidatus Daviesbacteria bacterium]